MKLAQKARLSLRGTIVTRIYIWLLPSAFLLSINWRNMDKPGVFYDEVFWVSSALPTQPKLFSFFSLFGHTLFIAPYAGSTKGLLYSLIFRIVDPTVYVIRSFSIVFAGIGISFLIYSLYKCGQKTIAALTGAVLLINPLVGMHAKYDLGLTSLGFTISCFFFGNLTFYLFRRDEKYLYILFVIGILGIWNKLIFAWILNGIVIYLLISAILMKQIILRVIILLNPDKQAAEMAKTKINKLLVREKIKFPIKKIFVLLSILYILFLSIYLKFHVGGSFTSDISTLKLKLNYIWLSLSGTSYLSEAWQFSTNQITFLLSVITLVLIFWNFVSVTKRTFKRGQSKEPFDSLDQLNLALCISFFCVVLQILINYDAKSPWHFLSLYPQVPLILSISLASLMKNNNLTVKKAATTLLIFVLGASFYSQIIVQMHVPKVLKNSESWTRLMNTNATSEFIPWAVSQDVKFDLFDWGLQTQLLLFDSKKPNKYYDHTWWINTEKKFDASALDKDNYLVMHSEKASAFPEVRKALFEGAKIADIKLCEVRSFFDDDGMSVIEVWRICKSPS
jgi:hypothetical protein